MVNDNNCQKKIPDCFHLNGLKQIGVNPYTQPPTESELAFENRYTKIGGKKKRLLKGGRGCVNAISPASYTFDLSKECQFAEVSPVSQECGSKAIKMEGGKKNRKTLKKKLRQKNKTRNNKTRNNKGRRNKSRVNK